jgi:hypothetical protein
MRPNEIPHCQSVLGIDSFQRQGLNVSALFYVSTELMS